jgi:hypothetical protein
VHRLASQGRALRARFAALQSKASWRSHGLAVRQLRARSARSARFARGGTEIIIIIIIKHEE